MKILIVMAIVEIYQFAVDSVSVEILRLGWHVFSKRYIFLHS